MEEGKILFSLEYPGSNRFRVDSDCATGKMEYLGKVWKEFDYSAAAKRRKAASYVWFAMHKGFGAQVGPFQTRKAAGAALLTG
jgi:hypothetical protein